MSDDLRLQIEVHARASGREAVDGLGQSVDELGEHSTAAGREAAAASRGIEGIGGAAQRAAASAVPAQNAIRDSAQGISNQINLLTKAYLAFQGGTALTGAAADLGRIADQYANLQARLQLVVGEGAALQVALQGVEDVALSTHTALDSTATLFAKISDAGKALNIGLDGSLALTETIAQAMQIGAQSAQASDAAITQLIQGLQSGVIRGDEFNSIMEQAPRLSKAMADGLGVTTGELRKMAEAGQLTSATVIAALQGQARVIEQEFGKLPATIGRALSDLSTSWTVFIGGADEATGASKAAAEVIESLAKNLDLVASALINSGQAWLGWKAYNIVAEFLALRTAVAGAAVATGTATAATVANTTATAANTAAQVANNAARVGGTAAATASAGAVGKLAAALSLVKGLSLAYLVTNLQDIGEWLGKAAYGFTELAKREKELERETRANAEASKAMAAADAERAQKARLAADAALGLSVRSKQLVGDFEELIKKGEKAGDAIQKLGKDLDVSSINGIAEAGAALDALARKGKLSADQVRDAWLGALPGKDLRAFEAEANAAFDGTAQGAARLAGALDAVLAEAVKRTGKDLSELASGVGVGAQTAINDFDVLLKRLGEVEAKGLNVGEVLASSLDQAGKAAGTEAAMRAIVERWEELGKQGLVAGERLREGLDGARARLDELAPGINSVTEAWKALGLKSQEELRRTAETATQAYETILQSGTATPAQIGAAFRRYAETVIEANGGVANHALIIQAAMRGLTIEVDAAGKAIVAAMGSGADETERFGAAAERAAGKVSKLKDAADRPTKNLTGTFGGSVGQRGDFTGNIDLRDNSGELSVAQLRAANKTESEIQDYYSQRRLSQQDQAAGLVSRTATNQSINHEDVGRSLGLTGAELQAFAARFGEALKDEMAALQNKLRAVNITSTEGYLTEYSGSFERAKRRAFDEARDAAARDARALVPASTHRVELVINGKTTAIDTASPDSAASLINALKELQGRAA
jgi:tape measure domain-containing protein